MTAKDLSELDAAVARPEWLHAIAAEQDAQLARATAEPIHDAESFLRAAGMAGRVNGPALLFGCFLGGRIHRADMAAVVADVWASAEFPQQSMPIDLWVHFFRMAEYPKPSGPLTLYRGSTPGRARAMSWTTDPEQARWFASRFADSIPYPSSRRETSTSYTGSGFRPAYVYTVEAPPVAVLAVMDQVDPNGRREHEVIVDPRLLPKVRRLEGD